MGAQTRTDILPYISIIPVFGYLLRGTSILYSRFMTQSPAQYVERRKDSLGRIRQEAEQELGKKLLHKGHGKSKTAGHQ